MGGGDGKVEGEGEVVGTRRDEGQGVGETVRNQDDNKRELAYDSQEESCECGCQYPGEAPLSYTDTLQRYGTTHTTHPL